MNPPIVAGSITVLLLCLAGAGRAATDDPPREPPKKGEPPRKVEPRPEPMFDGKPLSEWLKQLGAGTPPDQFRAADAIRRMSRDVDAAIPDLVAAVLAAEQPDTIGALLVELGPAAVPALTQALWNEKPADRVRAALILNRIGQPARHAIPVLVRQLKDTDSLARIAAVVTLSGLRAYSAVPDILKLLADPDADVQALAGKALVELGAPADKLLPTLIKALAAEATASRALNVLGRLGPEAAPAAEEIARLLPALPKDTGSLGVAVLGAIGPAARNAIPAVKRYGQERPEDSPAVAAALWQLGDAAAAEALLRAYLKDEKAVDRALAAGLLWRITHNEAAITALATMAKPGNRAAALAAERLGQIGPPAKAAVPELTALLTHTNAQVRFNSAVALARIRFAEKDTVPALVKLRKEDPSRSVQLAAAVAVCRLDPGPDAVAALAEGVKEGETHQRHFAVEQLGLLGPVARPAVPALKAALTDANERVRAAAAVALWQITRDPAALPAVIALFRSTDPDVRDVAAFTIGGVFGADGVTAVPTLMRLLWDPNPGVRSVSAESIGRVGPGAKTAVPALVAILGSDEAELAVSAACESLGLIGSEARAAVPELKRQLTHPNRLVRVHAALALWRIARDRSGEKELVAGLTDRDYHVRITAAEGLWPMTKDEQVIPFLVRTVRLTNPGDDPNGNNELYMAIRALERIGPDAKAVVPDLIRTLTHYDPYLAERAAAALKAIDAEAAKKAGVK